jgi:hypothetical protein
VEVALVFESATLSPVEMEMISSLKPDLLLAPGESRWGASVGRLTSLFELKSTENGRFDPSRALSSLASRINESQGGAVRLSDACDGCSLVVSFHGLALAPELILSPETVQMIVDLGADLQVNLSVDG